MCRTSLIQLNVTDNKKTNLQKAEQLITQAARDGVQLAVLPEMFNCPYDSSYFPSFAEEAGKGETFTLLARLAADLKIWIIGGSIPEKEGNQIFNTSFVFNNKGEIVARHRKVHLYDVDLENGITFLESETLIAGKDITVFDSPWGKIGLMICYDIRFPEMARIMTLRGARIIVIPAAFNLTTGPAHWEPQMRIRALDNQTFILAVSPARNTGASYQAYGHSMAVSPWGEVLANAQEGEEVLQVDLDMGLVDKIRREFPLLKHRRTDIYDVISK